ncbi:MAG: hypothetical protein ACREHF_07650 [Rhizomicrobium sp.]
MPRNVRRFVWLWWAAILIALVGIPQTYVDSWTTRAVLRQLVIAAVATLAFLTILFPFFWLAIYRRRNWARWVLLLAFIASLPLSVVDDLKWVPFPLANIGVGLISELVELLAFYFLFTGDAELWFRVENAK